MPESIENNGLSAEQDARLVELAALICDLARQGQTETLMAYISAGAPLDFTDSAGNTLIMLATYHEQSETVAALLEQGANPNILNQRGQTPLAGAVFKGDLVIARLLVLAGADPLLGTPTAMETADFFEKRAEFDPIFALKAEFSID